MGMEVSVREMTDRERMEREKTDNGLAFCIKLIDSQCSLSPYGHRNVSRTRAFYIFARLPRSNRGLCVLPRLPRNSTITR